MDCRLADQGFFEVPLNLNSVFQGIPGLKRKIPKFNEPQALKGKSPKSRNPRPWKENLQIQGISGLDRKISKFKESQILKGKSPNSRNRRSWKENPQIQGILGLERKIPKFKESQVLKGKYPNSRNSRFSRWRTNSVSKCTSRRHFQFGQLTYVITLHSHSSPT